MIKVRLASIERFKKQKLSQIFSSSNTKQFYIKDAQFDICNINNIEDNIKNKITWFWNKNINKTEFNLESERKLNKQSSLDKALPKTKEAVFMQSVLKKTI